MYDKEKSQLYYLKNKENRLKYLILNKEKIKLTKNKYKKNNKFPQRKYQLKSKFQITIEEYEIMFKKQNGLCAICHKLQTNRLLAVDHDHNTGKVRGLLCTHCNVAIGLFKDNIDTIKNSIDYLSK